jgi:hypothetical protein
MLVQVQCNEMQELQTCCQELFLRLNPVYLEIVTGLYHSALKVDLVRCGLGLHQGGYLNVASCRFISMLLKIGTHW